MQFKGRILVCWDPSGLEVARYDRDAVWMFGHDERIKQYGTPLTDGGTP